MVGLKGNRTIQKKVKKFFKQFQSKPNITELVSHFDEDDNLSIFFDIDVVDTLEDIQAFKDTVETAFKTMAEARGKKSAAMSALKEFYEDFDEAFPEFADELVEKEVTSSKRGREVDEAFEDSRDRKRGPGRPHKTVDDSNELSSTQKNALKDIAQKLSKHPWIEPFLYPVDKNVYPEYYETIENPMDLSTFKKRISTYSSLQAAVADLHLIWSNCLEFNQEGSEIATTAIQLAEETENMLEEKFGGDYSRRIWSKKSKKARNPPSTPLNSSSSGHGDFLSLNTLKTIYKKIVDDDRSGPFMYPVDERDAPGYHKIIKNPMDLTTMKKNFKLGVYDGNTAKFLEDMRLIWNNCKEYNDPKSGIYQQAEAMSKLFESLLEGYTLVDVNDDEGKSKPAKKMKAEKEKAAEKAEKSNVEDNLDLVALSSAKDKYGLSEVEMKNLLKLLKNYHFIEPFLRPVNLKEAPGYLDIIKTPMDISTVSKKLKNGEYKDNSLAFVRDVQLIWQNCISYNDDLAEITLWAKHCREYFEFELKRTVREERFWKELLRPPSTSSNLTITLHTSKQNHQSNRVKDEPREELVPHDDEEVEVDENEMDIDEEMDHDASENKGESKGRRRITFRERKYRSLLRQVINHDRAQVFKNATGTNTLTLKTIKDKITTYQTKQMELLIDLKTVFDAVLTTTDPESPNYKNAEFMRHYTVDAFYKTFPSLLSNKLGADQESINFMHQYYQEHPDAVPFQPGHVGSKAHAVQVTKTFYENQSIPPSKVNVTSTPHQNSIIPVKKNVPSASPTSQGINRPMEVAQVAKPTTYVDLQLLKLFPPSNDSSEQLDEMIEKLQSDEKSGETVLRNQIHKNATKLLLSTELPFPVIPGVFEVRSFGSISRPQINHEEQLLLPTGYTSMRSMRVCLVLEDQTSAETLPVVPYVNVNLVSSIVCENSFLLYRVRIENGAIVSEGKTAKEAWQGILGKELHVLRSCGSTLQRCRAVINRVCLSSDAHHFMDAVFKGSQSREVAESMWFREIHGRLVDGIYDNEYDFAWDMRLIFRNGLEYFSPNAEAHHAAERLSILFEDLFAAWVLSVKDKHVTARAQGAWDDWDHLRRLDGVAGEFICVKTGTKAKASEMAKCKHCEDCYLLTVLEEEGVNLPNKSSFVCGRCDRALLASNHDLRSHPFSAELLNSVTPSDTVNSEVIFVPAPDIGTGWCQARQGTAGTKRSSGKLLHFLSPLGYEVYRKDEILPQKEFENEVNKNLLAARAKEVEELKATGKKAVRKSHRRDSRRSKQTATATTGESSIDDIDMGVSSSTTSAPSSVTTLPIDVTALEEGRIVTGKLINFEPSTGFQLAWYTVDNEDAVIEAHDSGKDVSTMIEKRRALRDEDFEQLDFFGLSLPSVRSRLEGLSNVLQCSNYKFFNKEKRRQDLIQDLQNRKRAISETESGEEAYLNALLEERWFYKRQSITPLSPTKEETNALSEQTNQGGVVTTTGNTPIQNGFKPFLLGSLQHHILEAIFCIWDFLQCAHPLVGIPLNSLLDLVKSINPPHTTLTTCSQIVFDEVACMMSGIIFSDLRNRLAEMEEVEWQQIAQVYPLNILTWAPIAEKSLLIQNLPLSTEEVKMLLTNGVHGETLTRMKLLSLVYNYPLVDAIMFDHENIQMEAVANQLCGFKDELLEYARSHTSSNHAKTTKEFALEVLRIFHDAYSQSATNSLQRQVLTAILSWLRDLLLRLELVSNVDLDENKLTGAENVENSMDVDGEETLDPMQLFAKIHRGDRSYGGFFLSRQSPSHEFLLKPHDFNASDATNVKALWELKSQMLVYLERSYSLLTSSDQEQWMAMDRISIYMTLLDNAVCSKAFQKRLADMKNDEDEDLRVISEEDYNYITTEVPTCKAVHTLPKKAVCYFTGVSAIAVPDHSKWVIVPPEFLALRDDSNNNSLENQDSSAEQQQSSANYSFRARQQRSSSVSSASKQENVYAIRDAYIRIANARQLAIREQEQFQSTMDRISQQIQAAQTTNINVTVEDQQLYRRSKPLGFDRHGNSYWLFGAQEMMTIFPFDCYGKTLDPADPTTTEPGILMRNPLGQWSYHNSVHLRVFLSNLSDAIQCERVLRNRVIERYFYVKARLRTYVQTVKPVQQPWLERKIHAERWIAELPPYTGPNEAHRCRQLEVVWSRCAESRLNAYYASLYRAEEDLQRVVGKSERDAIMQHQRRNKELLVDDCFDHHFTKGWLRSDAFTRIREISASTTTARILADPQISQYIQSIVSKSSYLRKPSLEIPASNIDTTSNMNTSTPAVEEGKSEEKNTTAVDHSTTETARTTTGGGESVTMEVEETHERMQTRAQTQESVDGTSQAISHEQAAKMIADGGSISQGRSKAVEQLHLLTGEVLRIYPSGKDAAAFMNVSQSGISQCLTGVRSDCYGFKWRVYEGPPIDFEAIKDRQMSLAQLRMLQVVKGRSMEHEMENRGHIAEHTGYSSVSAGVTGTGSATTGTGGSAPLTAAELAAKNMYAVPAGHKAPIQHIKTSAVVTTARMVKLKGELLNLLYIFPEKVFKWTESTDLDEQAIQQAGDAAANVVFTNAARISSGQQPAVPGLDLSKENIERMAEKASRKAKRRLRRKLAMEKFVTNVQNAVTPQQLLSLVITLEESLPGSILFVGNKSVLPVTANTSAEVALRLFNLDRSIAFHELYGVENAYVLCPFKLRTQFTPRCHVNPLCIRSMGHLGKCIPGTNTFSRLPDHFQLAPPSDGFSSNAPAHRDYNSYLHNSTTTSSGSSNMMPGNRPGGYNYNNNNNQRNMPTQYRPREPEVILPTLQAIMDKTNLDVETAQPYLPAFHELKATEWI